jgi:hypothetical protein
MTQYHNDRSVAASTETTDPRQIKDNNALENRVKNLSDRVEQQADNLREIQRLVRKLQNEVRAAINAFNLKNRG